MIRSKNFISENDKRLRQKSVEVTFPLEESDKKVIEDMVEYLTSSQIPEIAEKQNLRPGMGLSAVQVGILKRYFVIVHEQETEEDEPQEFKTYIVINPKFVSNSEELIYAGGGEGCLSVNRDVQGIIPRYARVTVEGYDVNGNKIRIRAREELAIAMQHEMDHLEGILFFDKIDPKNPFKNIENMREI